MPRGFRANPFISHARHAMQASKRSLNLLCGILIEVASLGDKVNCHVKHGPGFRAYEADVQLLTALELHTKMTRNIFKCFLNFNSFQY